VQAAHREAVELPGAVLPVVSGKMSMVMVPMAGKSMENYGW
jgi:hypothetical protein